MPAPAKLSLDVILDEASAILHAKGLEAVTLRELASRLGVEAPSLYRHTGPKPRLLAKMTLRLFRSQLDEIGPRATWQAWLSAFGRKLWQTQAAIPDCARLVLTTDFTDSELAEMTGWATTALGKHGVGGNDTLAMLLSVQASVLGLGGLADGPSASLLRQAVPFDDVFEATLAVLIAGWEARLSQAAA